MGIYKTVGKEEVLVKHEVFDKKIEIEETDITFESIYDKPFIPQDYIEDIKKADILIIPEENFREEGDVLFPETTREFLEYLQEQIPKDMSVDIAISDEDFRKIELHSDLVNVATIIVSSAAFSIACSLVASFLYDMAKKLLKRPEDLNAKVKIISEETKTKKTKSITYEGPVSGIKEALEQASKDLFKDENDEK
ncbi:MAG: hypothetical protein PUJ54_02620 [Lachnospiraceae bacterium]|nr:hypothetical protein [Lachnospiraceae bacterium]MDY4119004.1 hypothetical protein [Lachnospiraceae bacterium]MEE1009348.1 hypothetical protein [Agathobacter sp.]